MDAKITKLRLSRMLSYDWIKIAAVAVAGIFAWVLIFTMTATRIKPSQQFGVMNFLGNASFNATYFYDDFEKTMKGDVFSYEVIESAVCDLAATPDQAGTLMEARLATNEVDVVFAANVENVDAKWEVTDEYGETTTKNPTYLEQLVSNRWYQLMNLDLESEAGFFKKMESYVNQFYNEPQDFKAATMEMGAKEPDAQKVERAFRARAKKNKDKRYKKEKDIQKGVANDVQRIKKYYGALVEFYDYLEEGYVEMTTVVLDEHNTGVFGINLCPNEETMGDLKKVAAYNQYYYVDENGQEVSVDTSSDSSDSSEEFSYTLTSKLSAKDMNIAFFRLEVEEGFQYESLLYVNHLVRTYRTAQE
ncbi:MAG: hypothetical protein IKD47_00340 [Clostridia bacterium]|nr:hypothetical protein [Clostridia bacterium]